MPFCKLLILNTNYLSKFTQILTIFLPNFSPVDFDRFRVGLWTFFGAPDVAGEGVGLQVGGGCAERRSGLAKGRLLLLVEKYFWAKKAAEAKKCVFLQIKFIKKIWKSN